MKQNKKDDRARNLVLFLLDYIKSKDVGFTYTNKFFSYIKILNNILKRSHI